MDKIDVSLKKLESPPKSREETEIIRDVGRWRALAIPLFGVSTAVGLYMKLKKPWLVNPIITGNKAGFQFDALWLVLVLPHLENRYHLSASKTYLKPSSSLFHLDRFVEFLTWNFITRISCSLNHFPKVIIKTCMDHLHQWSWHYRHKKWKNIGTKIQRNFIGQGMRFWRTRVLPRAVWTLLGLILHHPLKAF